MIPLEVITVFFVGLFCVGMFGMVARKNAIFMLLSLEIMLNALGIFLVSLSRQIDKSVNGEVFAFFVLLLILSNSTVGLTLLVFLFRTCKTNNLEDLTTLRW